MTNEPGAAVLSIFDQLIERIKTLTEEQAKTILEMVERAVAKPAAPPQQQSAMSMLGYAKKYNHELKTTEQWMKELRGGEQED